MNCQTPKLTKKDMLMRDNYLKQLLNAPKQEENNNNKNKQNKPKQNTTTPQIIKKQES